MPLNRRRLDGLVQKIVGAGEAQREGMVRWAARMLGAAACNGEIGADVAEALLVRAAARAGLAEAHARQAIASALGKNRDMMGEQPEHAGERSQRRGCC